METYTCAVCHSINYYNPHLLNSDRTIKCQQCHTNVKISGSNVGTGVGAFIAVILFVVLLDPIFAVIGWIIDAILWPFVMLWKALLFIYKIISWPFTKAWGASEYLYESFCKTIGWNNVATWWEISLFIVVSLGLAASLAKWIGKNLKK